MESRKWVAYVAAVVGITSLIITGCTTTQGSCQCQPTICPLHETSGCYCKICSPELFMCQTDSDCVIVDALCCSLADMVNPAAINVKFQDTWENFYRPKSCSGQSDSEALVKASACAPGFMPTPTRPVPSSTYKVWPSAGKRTAWLP